MTGSWAVALKFASSRILRRPLRPRRRQFHRACEPGGARDRRGATPFPWRHPNLNSTARKIRQEKRTPKLRGQTAVTTRENLKADLHGLGPELASGAVIAGGVAAVLLIWMAPVDAVVAGVAAVALLFFPGVALVRGANLGGLPGGTRALLGIAASMGTLTLVMFYLSLVGVPIALWSAALSAAGVALVGLWMGRKEPWRRPARAVRSE